MSLFTRRVCPSCAAIRKAPRIKPDPTGTPVMAVGQNGTQQFVHTISRRQLLFVSVSLCIYTGCCCEDSERAIRPEVTRRLEYIIYYCVQFKTPTALQFNEKNIITFYSRVFISFLAVFNDNLMLWKLKGTFFSGVSIIRPKVFRDIIKKNIAMEKRSRGTPQKCNAIILQL